VGAQRAAGRAGPGDRADQLLLGWTATSATDREGAAAASGGVGARVHRPPTAGPTIEQQLTQLRAGVANHPGWTVREEHLVGDDGHSGARLDRPGLDALCDHAARAAFDVVLAPRRIGWPATAWTSWWSWRGVRVVFCDRPCSDDPQEQLVAQLRGAVAELRADPRLPTGCGAGGWPGCPAGSCWPGRGPRWVSAAAPAVGIDPVAAVVVQELVAASAAGG
jgi:Resolvase, N terminal domain